MKKLITLPLFFIGTMAIAQNNSASPEATHTQLLTAEGRKTFTPKKLKLSTGVDLEYVEKGNADGIPVIFLHGLSDSWHSFETVLPHLPSTIRAFAISQRGHGNSGSPDNGYTSRDFANDIAAFIEQKKLGPVVIVGHSMGGINAQQFALDHPKLTKSLVIIDSDPNFKGNPGMQEFYESVLAMEGELSREFMIDFQKGTLANDIDSSYFNLIVDEGLKCSLPVFKSALRGIMQTDLRKKLRSFHKPTLIFWGNKDNFCLRKGQDIMKENIPNATFIEYLGTGHALHWEQPESFAKDLVYFIERKGRGIKN